MPEEVQLERDTRAPEAAHIKPASALAQLNTLLGRRWRWVAILAVASLLSGLAESGILAILAQAAASLVSGTRHVHVRIGSLHFEWTVGSLLLIALILAVIRLVLQGMVSVLPARIAAEVQTDRRSALFNAYTRASWSLQSRDREGHLQEIVTNQAAQATIGALYAGNLLSAGLTFLVLVVSALVLNAVAALIVLVAAIALFFVLRPLSNLGHQRSADLGVAYLNYAGAVSEAVRLAEETHVFGDGGSQRKRVGGFIARTQDLFFKTQVLAALPTTMYQSLVYLIIVAGLAVLNAAHVGHIASLGAVVLVLIRAGTYGQQAQGAYQYVRQALPYVERLADIQLRYERSVPPTGNRRLDKVRSVGFEAVSFEYEPGRRVLSGISFEVTGGEPIGILGPSGAGKSTLVQILLRLRPPSMGRYLINRSPAEEFGDDDWHKRVAFVPQEPQLLHASVRDNIRFFRELDDEAVERAAPHGGHPRRHNELVGRLRQDRRTTRGRGLRGSATADLPGARAGRPPRDACARRANQRARQSLGGADPELPGPAERRTHPVRGRPPHVHPRRLRAGDGHHRRPA